MIGLRVFIARGWQWLRARQLDRDFDQQVASHLDEATEEYVRQGLSAEDARQAALRSFGGVSRAQQAHRDARSFLAVDHLRRDARHALRALRRTPGFSLVVLIVLAAATGAATAVFGLLNAVVLRPLPFPESDRLVTMRHAAAGLGLGDAGLSDGLYFQYSERARSFESLALYMEPVLLNLKLPGEGTERVRVTYASAALFKVLRTTPAAGRLFTEEDGRPGFMNMRWPVPVLVSHQFWVQRLGADPEIVGRVLAVNDSPRKVVGVLPEGFAFPRADIQLWVLLEPRRTSGSVAGRLSWNALARMRPGVTAASAQAELSHILRGIEGGDPDLAKARLAPAVIALKDAAVGDVAQVIWLLFGGMAFLLIVACANAGGLFLVRAEHRAREMAVRRALGADGLHLARLFFIEALVLTGAATTVGLLLAEGILYAVIAFAPFEIPRTSEITLDSTSVMFGAAAAMLMAAFYGLVSVRRQRRSLTAILQGGGQPMPGPRGARGADAFIVLQVALALTLMAGSALMVTTYRNLSQRELGFSPVDLLTIEIGLPSRKAGQHVRIYQQVVERIRRLSHVDNASAASFVPLGGTEHLFPVQSGSAPVPFKFFTPGYFQTMGTPILEGERFGAGEHAATPSPVLISAALARRLYPGERAVGKTVRRLNEDGSLVDMRNGPMPPFTIAGVVADVREMTLRDGPTEIVYIPVMDPPVEQSIVPTSMRLVVRAHVPLPALVAEVRQAIVDTDSDLTVGRIQTMASIVEGARSREAFVGALLMAAAAVSLFLGAIGVYGSVAQAMRRRRREIAIRIALGAGGAEVVRMVTAQSIRSVLIGGAVGLVVSLSAGRSIGSLLFGVDAHDPIVFLAVTAALLSASGAAALLAARHASGVAPLAALRND